MSADLVLSSTSHPPTPELTTVNGIGMWEQWTRNFKTPLLALLDLMDNAFDATKTGSLKDFDAKILVYPDEDRNGDATGLCLLNNTPKHIKPMAQILEIYQSSKGNQSQSIGENGVGLKQSSATLSDLSFCLSKNLHQYSIGIVSKALQRENGCVLPSISFTEPPSGLQLMQHFTLHAIEGECVKEYGGGSLEQGVNRILEHFRSFDDLEEDNEHVFCVVLHHLKHGPSEQNEEEANYSQNAVGLMNKLKDALPRHYIHVPSTLEVRVDGDLIQFAYWQRRLVELSEFHIKIDPTRSLSEAPDWMSPLNGYTLRVYAGFDPLRLNMTDKKRKSPLNLFVYSRESGRLITHEEDARGLLGLTNSGSQYSQGLTIVVDDFEGRLPLNPTKQDLAFGEEAKGEVHQDNLFGWLSAVSRLYYNRHQSKFPQSGRRTLLTAEVKRHLPTIQNFQQPDYSAKPLSECDFTRFANISWTKTSTGTIRSQSKACQKITGADTLIKIVAPAPPVAQMQEPDAGGGSRKRKADVMAGDETETEEDDSEDDDRLLAEAIACLHQSAAASVLATTMSSEDEMTVGDDASPQKHHDTSAQKDYSPSDSSKARIENLERNNRELQASLERERQNRKDEKEELLMQTSSLLRDNQNLKGALERDNSEKQKLEEALKCKEREVTTLQRELEIQEAFCQQLRSRLAEDRALTLL